jgi:hypothetical protein
MHAFKPTELSALVVPAGQDLQIVPSRYLPCEHDLHNPIAYDPVLLVVVPAGQAVHDDAPVPLNVATGQDVHDVAPAPLNVPSAQSVHDEPTRYLPAVQVIG